MNIISSIHSRFLQALSIVKCHLSLAFIALFLACSSPLYSKKNHQKGTLPSHLFTLGTTNFPKHEVRAVWLTTIKNLDWPRSRGERQQKQELNAILDQLQCANINTILLQTRIRATTIYPSAIEPFDPCITGNIQQQPTYDLLQYAIEQCHQRGMELHAWIVTLPIGSWNATGCAHLRKRHPNLLKKIGDEGYLNPENSGTAQYISDIVAEITDKYDIDGIHLDYIRYPETWSLANTDRNVKRNYITNIVRKVYKTVKSRKRWVKVSCSPVGKYRDLPRYSSRGWNAYNAVAQDAQGWLKEGIMDQLYPMMYFKDNQFFPFALDWKENNYGRTVVPGLGIYFLHPSEGRWTLKDITRQLTFLRRNNMGFALFRSKFFTDNIKQLYTYTAQRHSPYPALVPPMVWEQQPTPNAPRHISVTSHKKGTCIQWQAPTNAHNVLYNVYASSLYPVDINDPRHLIAVRIKDNHVNTPNNQYLYYAVTTIDRYGNESAPCQQRTSPPSSILTQKVQWIHTNGNTLTIPDNTNIKQISTLIIADITGKTLHTVNITPEITGLNISKLPDGVYQLKTSDSQRQHTLIAFFTIRRAF